MSLDTLLEIGKILRESEGGLKHHCDIRIPIADKKSTITYWNIPVDNGTIKFDKISKLENENLHSKLLYLDYKNSADRNFRYLFGDIYNLKDLKKSFFYDKEAIKFLEKEDALINSFRKSLENHLEELQNLLLTPYTFIHFCFDGKHWYELEKEVDLILVELKAKKYFIESFEYGFYLKNYLHRTIQHSDYKAKTFGTLEETLDLMHSIKYSNRAQIREKDIKIIALPNVKSRIESVEQKEQLAKELEKFFEKEEQPSIDNLDDNNTLLQAPEKSKKGKPQKKINEDKLLAVTELLGKNDNFDVFDLIFTKQGGATSPDYDLIEISDIQKNFLISIAGRIKDIKNLIHKQFEVEFPEWEKPNLHVFWAFNNVLGDITKDKKKYRNHVLKVLPKIYTASYFRDDLLLSSFIQQVEKKLRDPTQKIPDYNFLKYEYYFLVSLRNPPKEHFESNYGEIEKMQNSESYKLGLMTGDIASVFSGENSPVKAFEKSFAGLITRRVSSPDDIRKLIAEDLAKMLIHHKEKINTQKNLNIFKFKTDKTVQLLDSISSFENQKEEKFDKNKFAAGFFESYFRWYQHSKKENNQETTETTQTGE